MINSRCCALIMQRKARLLLLALLPAVAAAAILLARQSREPTYAGRSLDSWVHSLNGARVDLESRIAITAIATNCLPSLVEQLKYNPLPRRARMAAIRKFLPKALLRNNQIARFIFTDSKEARANVALFALSLAGPAARAALPDLKRLAISTNSPACTRAMQALIRIDNDPAPTLAAVALHPKHPGRYWALMSAAGSPRITPGFIELLIPAVTNANEQVACLAIDAIGELARHDRNNPIEVFIQESDLLVPTLQRATQDPREGVSETAKDALRLLAIEDKRHP